VSYGEILGDKSFMYIILRVLDYTVTISFGYMLYCVCFNLYCGCFNLFGSVWGCVCVGFVMCGCVCVWVYNV